MGERGAALPPFRLARRLVGGKRPARRIALSALLYLAAGTGMAYVAGFRNVDDRSAHADWAWVALTAATSVA
jgi:hypothetical protein